MTLGRRSCADKGGMKGEPPGEAGAGGRLRTAPKSCRERLPVETCRSHSPRSWSPESRGRDGRVGVALEIHRPKVRQALLADD
jgi:hypothetical protein